MLETNTHRDDVITLGRERLREGAVTHLYRQFEIWCLLPVCWRRHRDVTCARVNGEHALLVQQPIESDIRIVTGI